MLIHSHVNLEGNNTILNKVVKKGNKFKRKTKSKCLTSFIIQKSFGSEKIRREYLKE